MSKKPSSAKKNQSSADTIASLLDADREMFADDIEPAAAPEVDQPSTEHNLAEHERTYQEQQAKIASLEEELHKAHDLFTRARAEADNIRRRADKSVSDAHKYGQEKMAKQLLDVVDSLERALEVDVPADQSTIAGLREGVQLTLDMLLATLNKFDIRVVDPIDEAFDPQLHEAMVMQPDSGAASGTVLSVIQKGYVLHDRLLRPARVVVAK